MKRNTLAVLVVLIAALAVAMVSAAVVLSVGA